MKLISVTWSYNDEPMYKNSFLYKSFIKYNSNNNFLNIHFNRNNYLAIEKEFKDKFEFQYEYILYKLFLLQNIIPKIEDNNIIYADSSDVACLGDISELDCYISNDQILFSSEFNQYPSSGKSWNSYPSNNTLGNFFLNSGLYIGLRDNISKLIEECITKILPLEYKDFGGDQGIYTYNYIHFNNIILDINNNIFLNTYLRSSDAFKYLNNRIICKKNQTMPLFIHDNGWNYGSPKFIEKFNLIEK